MHMRICTCRAPRTGAQNDVLQAALRRCGHVAVMASEEDDAVISIGGAAAGAAGGAAASLVAVFDPLDGSRNIDASIPTGTILGLYQHDGGSGAPHLLGSFC